MALFCSFFTRFLYLIFTLFSVRNVVKIVKSAVFSRGLGDFAQRDELCEDCRSVRLAFCRRCLNSERWENGRIFAFLLPWRWRQRRRTNSKACPQHAGKAETRECRMQNAECRIKNARIVFTLAMATILRRRIAWMENIKKLWEKRNEIVKPVIAWSVFGGTLAVAIALALIFWL